MLTDLQLAREKQHEFELWARGHNKELKVDMSVQVLTTGFWPTYKVLSIQHVLHKVFVQGIDITLPEEMEQGVQVFKEFYEDTTKHRFVKTPFVESTCSL